jgi:hypothetical protein
MNQKIADPALGLDRKLQAILHILSTVQPSFAEFNEEAQMYNISFRTGIFYEEGLGPQVWVAMFPQLAPEGVCLIQGIGVDIQGQIKISEWADLEALRQNEQPDPNRRVGDLLRFRQVQQAIDHVVARFTRAYRESTFELPRQTRLALL